MGTTKTTNEATQQATPTAQETEREKTNFWKRAIERKKPMNVERAIKHE